MSEPAIFLSFNFNTTMNVSCSNQGMLLSGNSNAPTFNISQLQLPFLPSLPAIPMPSFNIPSSSSVLNANQHPSMDDNNLEAFLGSDEYRKFKEFQEQRAAVNNPSDQADELNGDQVRKSKRARVAEDAEKIKAAAPGDWKKMNTAMSHDQSLHPDPLIESGKKAFILEDSESVPLSKSRKRKALEATSLSDAISNIGSSYLEANRNRIEADKEIATLNNENAIRVEKLKLLSKLVESGKNEEEIQRLMKLVM
jgi:hypothetical protein